MSSLFGSGGAALGGAAPSSAPGFLAATSGGGSAGSLFASSNAADSGSASNTLAAPGATGGGLFSSSSGNKASGAVLPCTNSTDGKISLFGGDGSNVTLSSGLQTSNLLQGVSKGDSRPAGAGFVGGSLFGNSSGSGAGSAGASSTSTLTGQGAVTTNSTLGGGSLFGSAGGKPFSILNTGSVPSAAGTTTGAGTSASSSQSSASGSDPSFNNSSSTNASGVSSSLFGTAQGAAGQTASSARLFGSDPSKQQAATSSSDSPQQGENIGQPSASLSTTFGSAAESKTGSVSAACGGLFGSTGQIAPASTTSGLNDTKTQDGVAPSGTSISAGGGAAGREATAAGKGDGGLLSLSNASRAAGTSDGGLFGKPNLSSTSSSAVETNASKGGQSVPPTSGLAPTAHSSSKDSTVPRAAAGGLPPPQEVALETLQHELLEEVLAKWERRLERRVGQFIAVAEEVESVEKAMIEESRKIQQVMNEQGKLERKQVYTARVIDSLEHQQRDLMTLLRSIESAVLELRCGGPRDISSSGKNTGVLGNYGAATAVATGRDPGTWFRLLKAGGGEEAGPAAASGEPDSRTTLPGKSFTDHTAGVASMPLLSSAEQLALERLRSFDQQLAEVGQSLSYTAETFQAGSLGAVAQVLSVHQAALRAAACQAAQIGERMRQLQDVWEVNKGRSGARGGFLKPSG